MLSSSEIWITSTARQPILLIGWDAVLKHKFIGYIKDAIEIKPCLMIMKVSACFTLIKHFQSPDRGNVEPTSQLNRYGTNLITNNDILNHGVFSGIIQCILFHQKSSIYQLFPG